MMLFFYNRYEHLLGSKQISATLKDHTQPKDYTLNIITPAVKFLGLPIGGGMVKISRLVNGDGNVIHARNYSPEIKQEVKAFKKTLKIPYLKLWKGYLIILSIAIIGSIIYCVKLNNEGKKYRNEKQNLMTAVHQLKEGQLYGTTFFTDVQGNNLDGLPGGWIKIDKIEGDTVFVQRSKQLVNNPLFKMEDLMNIKPKSDEDWETHIEKISYPSLKKSAKEENQSGIDLLYIGADRDKYSGVIMSLKGVE